MSEIFFEKSFEKTFGQDVSGQIPLAELVMLDVLLSIKPGERRFLT